MGWKIGDLGRFRTEDSSRPRFEVVAASKDGVTVWYGGATTTQVIPLRTFKYDCVRFWVPPSRPITERDKPEWLVPGVEYTLLQRNKQVQAVWNELGLKAYHTISVGGHPLTLRQIRADYTSNLVKATNMLVIVSLGDIIRYGSHQQTRYERLRKAKDPLRDDDLAFFELDP